MRAAGPPRSRTLADLLGELAETTPDALAVVAESGERLTFAELDRMAGRVAVSLAELGVRRGTTVGLLCSNRPEWLISAFAAARLGAVVAAFHTWVKRWDLEFMLESSGASLLITLDRLKGQDYLALLRELVPELWEAEPGAWSSARFPELERVAVIGMEGAPGMDRFSDWAGRGDADHGPPVPGRDSSAGDTAVVVYTSGSTARPKAVPLRHFGAIENGFGIGERLGLVPSDRVWLAAPLFWSYGFVNATMAAYTHGASVVLQEAFDAGQALALIERERCTTAYTLPNMTASLLAHPEFTKARVATLKKGATIGLPQDLDRAAHEIGIESICNIYGGTETYGNCCVTPFDAPFGQRREGQGPPLPGMQLRIVDPAGGRDCPPGEVGEIWVSGYVVDGYLGEEELTRQSFDGEFFHTGDLGFLDESGWIHFVARSTDMIKTGGINVSPQEVEEFIQQHPAVLEVGVVGIPDERLAQVPVAFVVPTPGAAPSQEELRAFCKDGIAGFKVPARIEVRDALPKTGTGKLDRRALGEWGAALEGAGAKPR